MGGASYLVFWFFLFFSQLLHSPKDFSTAMERLCERIKQNGGENGEHLCFLGSGREQEDQYMHMVVAKFLQQSVPYISVARGGFLGKQHVHVYIINVKELPYSGKFLWI